MKFVDDKKIPAHPYPELREVLGNFVKEVKNELAENLLGVYLVGSLAAGDFDADSDIDFLGVINHELAEANVTALPIIQKRIQELACYPAQHLEGSYITLKDLNDWNTVGKKKLYYFDNGSTEIEQSTHDNKWHVRWILRERGLTLIGKEPKTMVEPIPLADLKNEAKGTMIEYVKVFEEEIDAPLSFANSRFGQSFYVLLYCRMLHTLKTGSVQSKKVAADWAKQVLDTKWKSIIAQSWEERKGVRFGVKIGQKAHRSLLQETLEFIKYTVAQISNYEHAEG